jgi:hypothetical protein
MTHSLSSPPSSTRAERAAAVAAVLAAACRDETIQAADALRIIRHELRKRQTNKHLAIARRSIGAQQVIEAYAARGEPLPKNGSGDALHADHVYPVTVEHLHGFVTSEDWVAGLSWLGEVVCVTADENFALEVLERSGLTGPAKYERLGISFVDQRGQRAPMPAA